MYSINKNMTKELWKEYYKVIKQAYIDGWISTLPDGRDCYCSFAAERKPINKILKDLVDSPKEFKREATDNYRGYDIYSLGYLIQMCRVEFEEGYKEQYNLHVLDLLEQQYKDLLTTYSAEKADKLLDQVKSYKIGNEAINSYAEKIQNVINKVDAAIASI